MIGMSEPRFRVSESVYALLLELLIEYLVKDLGFLGKALLLFKYVKSISY
jgi:hypothetical protein